jgi:taurine dioxygenase
VFDVSPLGATLGARIDGADVRTLDDDGVAALRSAIHDHLVVFLPGQELRDDEQLAFAARLGDRLSVHPVAAVFDRTEPTIEVIEDTAEKPPSAEGWHTDVTFSPNPPLFGVLRAEIIPPTGGDTMWSNQYVAYEQLAAPVRELIDGLDAQHDPAPFLDGLRAKAGDAIAEQARTVLPSAVHPMVITHPSTGREALYVNRGWTKTVCGVGAIESRHLLAMLFEHSEQPRFTVRWQWTPGDLAIWDERATQHFAIGDHYPAHRRMRRCTVEVDAPPRR